MTREFAEQEIKDLDSFVDEAVAKDNMDCSFITVGGKDDYKVIIQKDNHYAYEDVYVIYTLNSTKFYPNDKRTFICLTLEDFKEALLFIVNNRKLMMNELRYGSYTENEPPISYHNPRTIEEAIAVYDDYSFLDEPDELEEEEK